MKQLTSEEYKERLLEVMLKIDRVCRERDIRYSIIYGTLLGAVRHRGFIPWDDDMDIAVTRNEYRKLKAYIDAHPELDLVFIDISDHPDTIYACGKICDTKTIVKESSFRTVEGYGAFIDVFPLDNLPDDERERKRFKLYARYLVKLIQHSSKLKPGKPEGLKHAFLLYGAFAYAHCFSTNRLVRKLDAYCRKYENTETKYFGVPYFITVFDKADFEELIELPFEGHMLIGPRNYDAILNAAYDNDYQTLPPPEERTNHLVECYWRD